MNLKAVRDVLYDITEMFFKGAKVIWAEQNSTTPRLPYITIKVGSLTKTAFPVSDKDGNRFYPCSMPFEVNLCTEGEPVYIGDNATGSYANTSVSDMLDFVKFLESDYTVDYLAGKGVDIRLVPPVRDLTGILNEKGHRFRAMAEFTVSYNEDAEGPYGIGGMSVFPNNSGGGTEEMANAEGSVFDAIEITEGGINNDEE